MSEPTTGRALIVVENESVPGDQRVWNQARSLRDAGWAVTVVCPKVGNDRRAKETLEGIEIRRFFLPEAKDSVVAFVAEYAVAIIMVFVAMLRLRFRRGFDVVQLCNPPDVLFLAALPFRLTGTKVIFDHHDLSPELWLSKRSADEPGGLVHRALQIAEKGSFAASHVVMSTNESYRDIAIERGGKDPDDVFVVRNGPDLSRFANPVPDAAHRNGRAEAVGYVGTMALQDGVDHMLYAVQHLVADGRDVQALLVGDGPELESLQALAVELGIADHTTFTGRVAPGDVADLLASTDVCCCPDPPLPLNDHSTMIKVLEYLAVGRAIAMYDLTESRRSAGDHAEYATEKDPRALADAIARLLDDPEKRARLEAAGLERVEQQLAWGHQVPHLLAAYERARQS